MCHGIGKAILKKSHRIFVVCGIFSNFEHSSKVLTFGKTQINLVFRSLIRTFAGVSENH